MKDRFIRLFEELEPPRGGLADLRARIETDRRRRVRRWQLQGAAAAAAVLVVAVLVFFPPSDRPAPLVAEFSPSLIRFGLGDAPAEPVTIPIGNRGEMAALRVPVDDQRVVLYLVAPSQVEPEEGEGTD